MCLKTKLACNNKESVNLSLLSPHFVNFVNFAHINDRNYIQTHKSSNIIPGLSYAECLKKKKKINVKTSNAKTTECPTLYSKNLSLNKFETDYNTGKSDTSKNIQFKHNTKNMACKGNHILPNPSVPLSNRFNILSDNLSGHTCDDLQGICTLGDIEVGSTGHFLPPDSAGSYEPLEVTRNHTNSVPLSVGMCNAQSVRLKTSTIADYLIEHDLDMYLIVETWLNVNDHKIIGDLKGNSYELTQTPREDRKGGGILCLYKKELNVKKMDPPFVIKTMEFMEVMLTLKSRKIRFVTIYRPKPGDKNRYTMTCFYREFSKLMSYYNLTKEELIINGDFNFHVNKPQDPESRKFLDILTSFNLIQHIIEPTHYLGNTLDLLISRTPSALVNHSVDTQISDHNNILFQIRMERAKCSRKLVIFRKLKSIKLDEFRKDIKNASDNCKNINELAALVNYYNEELRNVLNAHAPEQNHLVTQRKPTPWSSEDIKPEKKKRRRLERKWRKTRLQIDYNAFKTQRNKVNCMLNAFKVKYYSDLIKKNANNPRALFKIMNRALHRKEETPLPPHTSEVELATEFSNFFTDKIENIREYLDNTEVNNNIEKWKDVPKFHEQFVEFKYLTEDEVKTIILKSPNKYCQLDPIPTALLRECIDEILPLITKIINLSLKLGNMPKSLKQAIIKPLLKKLGLELIHKNYRPVSNLAFLSKLVERVVASQLVQHLIKNDLNDMFQSAYKQGHSTETALLRVQNDILMELDNGNVVLLVLLDLSAAFDTIDHEILLKRLSTRCGINGTVLKWFQSYLNDRTQAVNIGTTQSKPEPLKYGVPQGSVLGPLLFSIYNSPLGEIIKKHNISYHFYADDGQLYLSFSPMEELPQEEARTKLENCAKDVKAFLTTNKMKQNDDKTEFLIIGTPGQLKKVHFNKINICEAEVTSSDKARNLGVLFDKEMNLLSQVNSICKSGFYHVRNLSAIRNILDMNTAKTAAHAFVTSTLDYGNSLLYSLPKNKINKLQLVQNSVARVVIKAHKSERLSMTSVRRELHWLPVAARIEYKILILAWKAYHGIGPNYLIELLEKKPSLYSTRSLDQNLLQIPKTKLVKYGDRAFQKSAPLIWNKLTSELRKITVLNSFKSKLKTHLFTKYYTQT